MHGVLTALITPFTEDNALDTRGLRFLIQRQLASNVTGIVVLGTTGETSTLSEEERREVTRIAVEEANSQLPIYVGTGTNCTRGSIALTQQAKELGASGALVVTPYYNKPSQEGLYHHFKKIAEEGGLPLLLYNIPQRTAVEIELSTLQRLAEQPNIIGIKEASGSIRKASEILDRIPELPLLAGDDQTALSIRSLGGSGLVSVLSNWVPELMCELVESPIASAQQLHRKLSPLFDACALETNPIPIKAIMRLSHLPAGACRLPLMGPSKKQEHELQRLMNKWSLQYGATQPQPC